jgi:hypothetical protein
MGTARAQPLPAASDERTPTPGGTGRHRGPPPGRGLRRRDFLATLAATTSRPCRGVDPHPGYVREGQRRHQRSPSARGGWTAATLRGYDVHVGVSARCPGALPGRGRSPPGSPALLRPDGVLVLTVPARHVFLAGPRQRQVPLPAPTQGGVQPLPVRTYTEPRFVDEANGLFGDMSIGKGEQRTRPDVLRERLGLEWLRHRSPRWRQPLLAMVSRPVAPGRRRMRALLERAIWLDAGCSPAPTSSSPRAFP